MERINTYSLDVEEANKQLGLPTEQTSSLEQLVKARGN